MGLLKQIERILCMCIWNTIARWYLVNYMFMLYFHHSYICTIGPVVWPGDLVLLKYMILCCILGQSVRIICRLYIALTKPTQWKHRCTRGIKTHANTREP